MSEKESLVQLSNYAIEAHKLVQQCDGELSPEVESFLDQVTQDLAVKIDGYKIIEDEMYEQAAKFKELSKVIAAKAKAVESTADRLRERILFAMRKMEVKELTGNLYAYRVVSAAPKLVVDEQTLAHEWTMEVITPSVMVPDKTRIKAALAEGQQIAGASLEPVFYPKSGMAKKPKLKGKKDV